MSSILKALKKLEGEKAQRDELSTAVASDILRSSRQKRVRSMSILIVFLILALILCVLAGFYIATSITRPEVPTSPAENKNVALPAPQITPVVIDRQAPISDPGATTILPGLSGIVYQAKASDRLAIINDLPVMEGTLVEGFVVRQIYPDKVVISRDGVDYDLRIQE